MKLSSLKEIVEVLNNSNMSISGSAIMITDIKGELIASIVPYINTITFYTSYTHLEALELKMKERGINLFDLELNRQLLED